MPSLTETVWGIPSSQPNWTLAKCVAVVETGKADPDDWFPTTYVERDRAKAVCNGCPIKRDCLAYAKAEGLVGYWGGRLLGYKLEYPTPTKKIPATGQRVTCCPAGHSYQQYGFTDRAGSRVCRMCKRKNDRNSYRRNHAKKQATKSALLMSSDRDRQLLAAEITRLTAEGNTIQQIAETLGVSQRSVDRYRAREGEAA